MKYAERENAFPQKFILAVRCLRQNNLVILRMIRWPFQKPGENLSSRNLRRSDMWDMPYAWNLEKQAGAEIPPRICNSRLTCRKRE